MDQCKVIYNKTSNIVDIYLYGTIGSINNGNKIDGDYVASQIRFYDEKGVKIIKEHLNSDGGEVTNGLSIIAANLNCENSKVYTYNEGVCASMMAIIHQTGSKKFATPYSQFMMHEPSMCDETIDSTQDEIIKKRLQAAKNSLLSILTLSTGLDNAKLETMMHNETWLSAKECEAMGFVTPGCVIDYPNKPTIKKGIKPKDLMILVNQAFNNLNNKKMAQTKCEKCGEEFNFKEHKIENENAAVCPGCKLKVDSEGNKVAKSEIEPIVDKNTVDQISFNKLSDQVKSLNNLINGLQKENAILKAESDANKKSVTATILDQAIEHGKLVSTVRDQFLIDYANNPEGLRKIVDAIPMPHNSITSVIDKSKEDAPIPGGFKTLRELEKANPALAEKFALENPAAYNKLYTIEYK
jgi:ATP-dependent protease ClpP protease subunit/DNA-directed RNA polymerase subunit RPC12/RpoP